MSRRRGALAWFAENHVASNLLMLFLLIGGAIALTRLTIEVFPELDADTITVRVPYLGASPAEAEQGVVLRVEEAIDGIEGIERLRSTAQEGMGTVVAELEEDADDQRVLDDVKAAVDRIETFPEETEKPVISEVVTRRQVISLVVYGRVPEATLKSVADRLRDELTALEEISQVDLFGVREYEISVEVSEENLRRYGLTFDQVARVVRESSLDLPGGAIETEGGEILVRTTGQRYRGQEFEDVVVVSRPDGTRVLLGEVAVVRDAFEDSDVASRFQGTRAAHLRVYRVGDQGALELAETVRQYVEETRPALPAGVNLAVWEDQSEILRSRLELLLRNAGIGLVLVFLSLSLFLVPRLAFWTTMGIPISFLGGLLVLPWTGVTINMISLFAFIVVLGIVVDDAIVVGENVFQYMERGQKPLEAAISGVREMAVPVTFAILTTVAAFSPLLFTEGMMGKVMRQIPIVVIAVLLISLVEALLILPAHLAHASGLPGPVAAVARPVGRAMDSVRERAQGLLTKVIDGPYRRTLDLAVRHRYTTLAIAVAIFLVTVGIVLGGLIRFTFMPRIDADNMVANVAMHQGTPVEQTEETIRRLEEAAFTVARRIDSERPDDAESVIRYVSSTIGQRPSEGRGPMAGSGTGGANLGEVNVELLPSAERGISSNELARRWREATGPLPGVKELTFSASLFSAGESIDVELAHRDFDLLLRAVERLKEEVASFPGVTDVADSFVPGKRELELQLTPTGRAAGLTLFDLARQTRSAFYGAEAQRIQRGRDDVRVMVRYPEEQRSSLEDIERLRIRLPDGVEVPFGTVAEVTEGRGYAVIERTDRRRVVSVTADVDETVANANDINREIRSEVLPQLVRDIPGLSFSFEGEQREQQESLHSLGINFLVAQLAIFGLLAIPFRSYTQPLIVMSAIPFGAVGAIGGHLLMGYDLTLLSMFGLVALTGVVVNDSLIMIDLINRERAAGVELADVVVHSGTRRFRPILLTTVTTFLGLSPMILETSLQARFLIPMAVSLGFGVVFATAITLILIPTLYMILEDLRTAVMGRSRARESALRKAEKLGGGEAAAPSPATDGAA